MHRFDLYTHVHKALRSALFEALEAVGRADFARGTDVPQALAAVRYVLRFTAEHAEHEDRDIHPLLHQLAPELAADLETGHDRFEAAEREIGALLERIGGAAPEERAVHGRRLHELLGAHVADHLSHMVLEESRANRVLWAHQTDAQLLEIQQRIVGAIGPAGVGDWLAILIPSGNLSERAGLLAGLRAAFPAETFAALTAAGRARLGEPGWQATEAAMDELAALAGAAGT